MRISSEKPNRGHKIADLCFLAMIIAASIPETVVYTTRISEIPIDTYFFMIGFLVSLTTYFLNHKRLSIRFIISTLALLLMCFGGWLQSRHPYFSPKVFGVDVAFFSALVAGITWAEQRSFRQVLRAFTIWGASAAVMAVVTIIGLSTGYVPAAPIIGRTLVFSLFGAAFVLLVVSPFTFSFPIAENSGKLVNRLWITSAAFIAIMLLVAVFTGTRSFFLAGLVCVLICARILLKTLPTLLRPLFIMASIGLIWSAVLSGDLQTSLGTLGERLASTDIEQETRLLELQMMFEQNETSDFILGRGFGCRFESPVGNFALAIAPHVGIFTFLLKGGVVAFVIFVIVPMFSAIVKLSQGRSAPLEMALAGGVLLYLVVGATSGGWQTLHLFLYGVFYALLPIRESRFNLKLEREMRSDNFSPQVSESCGY